MRPLLPDSFNLRNSVIFAVLLPLLAVLGLGGVLVLATLEQRLEQRLQDDIAVIARTLQAPLARSLERERTYSLDSALRSTSDFSEVYGVYVYDTEGRQVARADEGNPDSIATLAELGIAREEPRAEYGSIGGREVYSYFTPLTDVAGNSIGVLQVTRSVSEMHDYLARLRRNVVVVMLASCVFFVAIIVAGHHLVIGRPLKHLTQAMTAVRSGDTDARARVGGPAEIRRLASRFNAMVDGLAERDAVLASERERQRRLEHKLRQSEKYAFVGRLAAGVAHELGAPLNVVDGHAQRLIRDKPAGSREHESLSRIRESTARMVTIVEQLLGFGRAGTTAADVSVERLVSLAAADVRSRLDERGVELEIAPGNADATIRADQNRLRQALVHLLRNAAYAASAGGRIRVGWSVTGGSTRLFVENSGGPVPPEDRERIFEPFFTTKPAGVGSGLGLAIVKGTVADHGAEIRVYDSELGGAGFEVEFPTDRDGLP